MINWPRVILGGICGVVATGPMSIAMVLWHRHLPRHESYPLPPREITGVVLERAGVEADDRELSAATLIAHFAYGGAAGAIYGALPQTRNSAAAGAVAGLALWAGSYLGLLPALGLLRSATDHPARRSLLMIGAHLIWGTCLAVLHRILNEDAGRQNPALREGLARADAAHRDCPVRTAR